jgi:MFS family permease
VAIGTISTAYGLAIIGSTVGQPNFYSYFNLATAGQPGYDHTTNMIGALNGVNSAGAIAGCISQAWSADKYGRKRTMQIGSVILIVGGALCAGAVDIAMFLVGRFIAGMGSGILACVVPIYQAEVSTPGELTLLPIRYASRTL